MFRFTELFSLILATSFVCGQEVFTRIVDLFSKSEYVSLTPPEINKNSVGR